MIQPYEDILNELAGEVDSLGFARESESAYGAMFRRADGFRFLILIERYDNGFTVELLPEGVDIGRGYSAILLMEAIAQGRHMKTEGLLERQSADPESIRYWWREFGEFLRDKGNMLNPMSPTLKAQYDCYCKARMREFGFE